MPDRVIDRSLFVVIGKLRNATGGIDWDGDYYLVEPGVIGRSFYRRDGHIVAIYGHDDMDETGYYPYLYEPGGNRGVRGGLISPDLDPDKRYSWDHLDDVHRITPLCLTE